MQNAAASPLLPPPARARVMNLFITDLTHAASKRHTSHKSTVVRAGAPSAAATAQRSALPLPPLTSLTSAQPLLHRNHQAAPNTFFYRAVDCAGFIAGSRQTWQRKRGFPAQHSRMCRNGGCHAAPPCKQRSPLSSFAICDESTNTPLLSHQPAPFAAVCDREPAPPAIRQCAVFQLRSA